MKNSKMLQCVVVKEEKEQKDIINPWHMTSLSDFLFYCCVECNFKDKNEEKFVYHATSHHPKSREIFANNIIEVPENQDIYEQSTNEDDVKSDLEDIDDNTYVDKKEVFHEVISQVIGDVRFKCCFCDYKRLKNIFIF